ncbi:AAA family ATPase [Lactococcus petauri]|nr:AAA family ATPase [Lactococcus petauri]
MSNFYIEKLIAQGKEKQAAEIHLYPGLNIITGPSNSGKSMIADYIEYLFGGNNVPFTEEETGYSSLTMSVSHPTGTYLLQRQINTGTIHVSHQTSEKLQKKVIRPLSTGKFNTRSGEKDNISKFWLELIGIKEDYHIIKNSSYVTQKLGWRTFSHSLLIDEDHIIQNLLSSYLGWLRIKQQLLIFRLFYFYCMEKIFQSTI